MHRQKLVVVGDTMEEADVSKFLEIFPTYRLHKTPESDGQLWVFEDKSLSADPDTSMICDKIKSVLSTTWGDNELSKLVEFWAPVAIDDRLLLSTSGQPFAVIRPNVNLAVYRIRSEGYKYNKMDLNYANKQIDINEDDVEEEDDLYPMIITAFLGRLTQIVYNSYDPPVDNEEDSNLTFEPDNCVMIPVFCPSQSSSHCIGVFCFYSIRPYYCEDLRMMTIALEKAGLSMFHVHDRIPYKIVHGLKLARDQIEDAIEIVCESLNIELAQVWITNHEDENHVPFSSSSHYTQKKQTLALKLTGYCYVTDMDNYNENCHLKEYYHLCDMVPLNTGESRIEKTLADFESRFYKTYDDLNKVQLESLKRCGTFFVNGAELDEESNVIDVHNYQRRFKIFEGKQVSSSIQGPEEHKLVVVGDTAPSKAKSRTTPILISREPTELQWGNTLKIVVKNLDALEEVKESVVADDISPLKVKYKTAPKYISRERIEKQFGHTMKEAAHSLDVSVSTLKRKCKEHGIYEWQGLPKSGKRKVNQSQNQSDTGANLVPSASERNDNNLTIKAEYSDDMIKFNLLFLDATFVFIKSEIGKRFKLTPGTYKLKYFDEDGDWILLASQQEMIDCIRSSKRLDRTVVRLRVLPSA
ncbi:protein NLP5-like isoform X2 [Rutidosis leptorrhynchoides]|uniref:protein NLP5-like isoform X2 n=1 Tax=Rutidosis leptorrhynchoides TaxID=125765 RepID=UPI003A9961F7